MPTSGVHAVVGTWDEPYSESGLEAWAGQLRQRLTAGPPSLGLLFASSAWIDQAPELLDLLRIHAHLPVLVGCTSGGLVAGDRELPAAGGFVLALFHLPGARLRALHVPATALARNAGAGDLHRATQDLGKVNGWLIFAEPFHLRGDSWLPAWQDELPGAVFLGGLASPGHQSERAAVFVNGQCHADGAAVLALAGDVALEPVVSQGCTPVGHAWTVTRSERNLLLRLGNRPAYEVLAETLREMPDEVRARARGNLFVGLAATEYRDELRRGDFLVRQLLAADPKSGALAVGAQPRAGQTVQFHLRDAASAAADLDLQLQDAVTRLGDRAIYGGCLALCLGRGQALFGREHHDAISVQQALGPLPVAGFFANGEIGPVGNRSHLHGFTASLALFTAKE